MLKLLKYIKLNLFTTLKVYKLWKYYENIVFLRLYFFGNNIGNLSCVKFKMKVVFNFFHYNLL